MTFEEFKKATPVELQEHAKHCFDRAHGPQMVGDSSNVTSLLEAQFYMQELDRRHDSWIARRDLILEIVVIILIGAEIILAIWQGKDENALMTSQNTVLQNLQTSSSATAGTMQLLQSTTAGMNHNIVTQLALTYEIPLTFSYDHMALNLLATNGGLPSIKVWGFQTGVGDVLVDKTPKIVERGKTESWSLKDIYDDVSLHTPNGASITIPMSLYVENEGNQRFTIHGTLFATRHAHEMDLSIYITEIVPGWVNTR